MKPEVRITLFRDEIPVETVADILGIHKNSVVNKLNGKTPFTVDEAVLIKRELLKEATLEDFARI